MLFILWITKTNQIMPAIKCCIISCSNKRYQSIGSSLIVYRIHTSKVYKRKAEGIVTLFNNNSGGGGFVASCCLSHWSKTIVWIVDSPFRYRNTLLHAFRMFQCLYRQFFFSLRNQFGQWSHLLLQRLDIRYQKGILKSDFFPCKHVLFILLISVVQQAESTTPMVQRITQIMNWIM